MEYFDTANYGGNQNNTILSGNNINDPYLTGNNNFTGNYNEINTAQYPIQNTTTEYNYTTNDNQYLDNIANTNYTQNSNSNNNNQLYGNTLYKTEYVNYGNMSYSTKDNNIGQTYYNNIKEDPKQNKEIIYQNMNENYNYDPNTIQYIDNNDFDINKYINYNSPNNNAFYYNNNVEYGNTYGKTNNNVNKVEYGNTYGKTNNNVNNIGYGNTYGKTNNNVNNIGYETTNTTNKNYVNYINNSNTPKKQTQVTNKGITIPKKAIVTPSVILPVDNNSCIKTSMQQSSVLNNANQNKSIVNKSTANKSTVNNSINQSTRNQISVKQRPLNNSDFINIVYKDIGMTNSGNTSYLSSCLQVLIHCPLFIYKFFNMHSRINKDNTPISFHLFKICVEMMNTVNTLQKYIDITHFKNAFGVRHPTFLGLMENDSHEFCRTLLEDISKELNEINSKPPNKELTNTNNKNKVILDKEFDQHFKEREKSIITDLFYSQIITTCACQCKAETYSFQKLLYFPLLLLENEINIEIKDLLKKYFESENILAGTECEKCKKKERKREIKISRPPEILILSLQRIDKKTNNKNKCIVTFPKVLDMSEFIDHECGFDKDPIYNLYAVINHSENKECGHYFADIRNYKSKEWLEFNDNVVKNIGSNIESFPNAYSLFYIKRQKNPS